MGSLIGIIVNYLPYFVKAAKVVPEITEFIQRTRDHLKQTQEWTAEQEAEFDRHVEEVTSQPWWTRKGK